MKNLYYFYDDRYQLHVHEYMNKYEGVIYKSDMLTGQFYSIVEKVYGKTEEDVIQKTEEYIENDKEK